MKVYLVSALMFLVGCGQFQADNQRRLASRVASTNPAVTQSADMTGTAEPKVDKAGKISKEEASTMIKYGIDARLDIEINVGISINGSFSSNVQGSLAQTLAGARTASGGTLTINQSLTLQKAISAVVNASKNGDATATSVAWNSLVTVVSSFKVSAQASAGATIDGQASASGSALAEAMIIAAITDDLAALNATTLALLEQI